MNFFLRRRGPVAAIEGGGILKGQVTGLVGQLSSPILDAYFERRDELKRFFAARFGSPDQAEDLVQELYIKVAGLDAGQVIENPGAFLYRLAFNLMLDHRRGGVRRRDRDTAWRQANHQVMGDEDVADAPSAEDALIAKRQLAALAATLERLPTKTQKVFRLHKFEGLSHAETATRLGMSRRMVEKHMSAALKTLVKTLGRP